LSPEIFTTKTKKEKTFLDSYTAANLWQVLQTGYQRQRAAAAIELTILQPGQALFEVRAPGFRQQRILASGRS
jgi:hypothetical protein